MDINISNEMLSSLLRDTFTILTTITISQSLITSLFNKINLTKISKYDGCPIKECSFIDNVSIESRKKQLKEKNLDDLLPFVEKLSNYTSHENLKTVYKNLNSLRVKKKRALILRGVSGTYSQKNNTIEYVSTSSLGHEFLHLSSSFYDENKKEIYAGFAQKKKLFIIGEGLNEGYTELLASRIFNKNNKAQAYKSEVKIAKLIELFFDNPKDMEKLYFNHNLLGFVNYMERFATREEIINILLEIDKMHFHKSLDTLNPFNLFSDIKIQLKLYKLFVANNTDMEKLRKFTNLICENNIIRLILNNNKMKLYKENPYIQNEYTAKRK